MKKTSNQSSNLKFSLRLDSLDSANPSITFSKPEADPQSSSQNKESSEVSNSQSSSNPNDESKREDFDNDNEDDYLTRNCNEDDSSLYIEKKVRTRPLHWELKWVRVPNVLEYAPDIFIRKWVREEAEVGSYLQEREVVRIHKCQQEDCNKIFPDLSSLKKHMLVHGERQFICPVEGCGKKFLDNSKLRRHQLVHTGERPFKCDICGKLFSLDFNLRTHLRTHTGEKPYICKHPGCSKRFSQSSNLSAHEKVHLMPAGSKISGENSEFLIIFPVFFYGILRAFWVFER